MENKLQKEDNLPKGERLLTIGILCFTFSLTLLVINPRNLLSDIAAAILLIISVSSLAKILFDFVSDVAKQINSKSAKAAINSTSNIVNNLCQKSSDVDSWLNMLDFEISATPPISYLIKTYLNVVSSNVIKYVNQKRNSFSDWLDESRRLGISKHSFLLLTKSLIKLIIKEAKIDFCKLASYLFSDIIGPIIQEADCALDQILAILCNLRFMLSTLINYLIQNIQNAISYITNLDREKLHRALIYVWNQVQILVIAAFLTGFFLEFGDRVSKIQGKPLQYSLETVGIAWFYAASLCIIASLANGHSNKYRKVTDIMIVILSIAAIINGMIVISTSSNFWSGMPRVLFGLLIPFCLLARNTLSRYSLFN